jgi:K+-transporting ATPase ATPase A chain
MALAGSLAAEKDFTARTPARSPFPAAARSYVLLLGTILLVGALNFLPVLALGPIVEHFLMLAGETSSDHG